MKNLGTHLALSYSENFHFSNLLKLDVENLNNESFLNKTIYSLFCSVEATNFKNVILNKIQLASFKAAEV